MLEKCNIPSILLWIFFSHTIAAFRTFSSAWFLWWEWLISVIVLVSMWEDLVPSPRIYTLGFTLFLAFLLVICQNSTWITQNSAFWIKCKYSLNLALFFWLVVFVALFSSLLGFVGNSALWFSISDLYCKRYASLLYDSTVSSHSPTLICVLFFSLGLALTKDSARKNRKELENGLWRLRSDLRFYFWVDSVRGLWRTCCSVRCV